MTAAGRAFFGAAFGALLTLLAHPTSRPFLLSLIARSDVARLQQTLGQGQARLASPRDLPEAALWLHTACERIDNNRPLKPTELKSVLAVTDAAVAKDANNAFWYQMRAVFLGLAGRHKEALAAWTRASRADKWVDYQSDRLMRARAQISAQLGASQSWQLAYVYYGRSTAASRLIEQFARQLIASADPAGEQTLARRYDTLRNGSLIRDRSRSILIGLTGTEIVEIASYPGSLSGVASPKKLLLAQIAMYNNLIAAGRITDAREADLAFKRNESWRALTQREDFQENAADLSTASVYAACLPSALAASFLVGALLYGLGIVLGRSTGQFSAAGLAGVSAVLGFLTYALSKSIPTAVVIALCAAFLAFGPSRGRKAATGEVGPLFELLAAVLALGFFFTFAGYVVGFALPAEAVFPLVGFPGELFGNRSMFVGLSAIILGLLILAAPIWALVQRRSTSFMLGLALRRFGSLLAVASLGMVMIATPSAVFYDRYLGETLKRLVENEPVYYLLQ